MVIEWKISRLLGKKCRIRWIEKTWSLFDVFCTLSSHLLSLIWCWGNLKIPCLYKWVLLRKWFCFWNSGDFRSNVGVYIYIYRLYKCVFFIFYFLFLLMVEIDACRFHFFFFWLRPIYFFPSYVTEFMRINLFYLWVHLLLDY